MGDCYAVVTPLRKAASYEPRIAILGIWGDTWLTRGKYGIYVAVRGSYGVFTGSTWRLLPRKISPIYCRVSYVAVTRIPSLVLRNTWHYVIIRYSCEELSKFVLHCSYEAALLKGVTTALEIEKRCCLCGCDRVCPHMTRMFCFCTVLSHCYHQSPPKHHVDLRLRGVLNAHTLASVIHVLKPMDSFGTWRKWKLI